MVAIRADLWIDSCTFVDIYDNLKLCYALTTSTRALYLCESIDMPKFDELKHLRELLEIQQNNEAILARQASKFGEEADAPLHVQNQLKGIRREIAELTKRIAQLEGKPSPIKPAKEPIVLTPTQKMELSNALVQTRTLSDRSSRETFARMLPNHITERWNRSSAAFNDVLELVNIANDFENGPQDVITTLEGFEKGTIQMRNVLEVWKNITANQ